MEESLTDPLEITRDPDLIKDAQKDLSRVDVLVCGGCRQVYHFAEEFQQHKAPGKCSNQWTVSCDTEEKPQVWGFTLWKAKHLKTVKEQDKETPSSWEVYQKWVKLGQAEKELWIAAGRTLQFCDKVAAAKIQQIPIKVEKRLEKEPSPRIERDPLALDDNFTADQSIIEPETNPISVIKAVDLGISSKKAVRSSSASEKEEFNVEKIVGKRFNPRKRVWEYQVKWENYKEETWEPLGHLENCKALVEEYENKARMLKEKDKTMSPRGRGRPKMVQPSGLSTTPVKIVQKKPLAASTPAVIIATPGGRPQRTSKQKAVDQVKQWCGNISDADEPSAKRLRDDGDSDDSLERKLMRMEGEGESTEEDEAPPVQPPKKVAKIVHAPFNNGLGSKLPDNVLIPDAKGVVRISQKQLPSLSSGVYIMSKSSGIIKLDPTASKIATSGGQAIVKVGPKIGQTQIKIIKKEDGSRTKVLKMKAEQPAAAAPTRFVPQILPKISPVAVKTSPMMAKMTPIAPKTATIAPRTTPIVTKTFPGKTHPIARSQPVAVKSQPVLSKPQPVVSKPQPVAVKAQPVVAKPASAKKEPEKATKPEVTKPQPPAAATPKVVKEETKTVDTRFDDDDDSDYGLEELEFPADLPLPEPESPPPSDFVLDPFTGKVAGQEYPDPEPEPVITVSKDVIDDSKDVNNDSKDVVNDSKDIVSDSKDSATETIDNIVKLAAADITEDDLKPDVPITTATPTPVSNAPPVTTTSAVTATTASVVASTSSPTATTTTTVATTPTTQIEHMYAVTSESKTKPTSILNTAIANSNILQKTLLHPSPSPRPRAQPKVINQSVAKPRTTISPVVRNSAPKSGGLVRQKSNVLPRPKFNIAPMNTNPNIKNVYSKANSVPRRIGNTTVYRTKSYPALQNKSYGASPSKSYGTSPNKSYLASQNRSYKAGQVLSPAIRPKAVMKESSVVMTTAVTVGPVVSVAPAAPKPVISMPSLAIEDEPVAAVLQAAVEATAAQATVATTTAESAVTETADLSTFTLADGDRPMFLTDDDGTIYQVAGQNEEGQTILLTQGSDGQQQCLLVTSEALQDVAGMGAAMETAQAEETASSQVLMEVQEPMETAAEDQQPVVAQFLRTEPPSPGGTHKVVVMMPDGDVMVTQVTPEEYASLELDK